MEKRIKRLDFQSWEKKLKEMITKVASGLIEILLEA